MPSFRSGIVLAAIVVIAGCDSGPATYDVSGNVTYQGKPVTSRGAGWLNQAVRPHRKSGAVPQL